MSEWSAFIERLEKLSAARVLAHRDYTVTSLYETLAKCNVHHCHNMTENKEKHNKSILSLGQCGFLTGILVIQVPSSSSSH